MLGRTSGTRTLYLDEHVPPMRNLLAPHGIEVIRAQDVATPGSDDASHLKRCADNGWVLVTFDFQDYLRLHSLWNALVSFGVLPHQHSGILTPVGQPPLPDEWARAIGGLVAEQGINLTGMFWRWNPTTNVWTPQ